VKALLGTTTLLAILLPGIAQAQGQQVNIFWFEDASCAAWTKSAGNKAIRLQYESWVRGFVSGYNYGNPAQQIKIGVFPGSNGVYQYLDQYCRDNPKQSFVGGAIQMTEELREASAPARPAPARKESAKAAPAAAKSEPANAAPAAK
jgi:hypothetical protein